jgi:hypothetical protein
VTAKDIRSLALFRIGLAIATIGDLVERSLDLRAHYSDEGIFPRYVLFEQYPKRGEEEFLLLYFLYISDKSKYMPTITHFLYTQ